MQRRNRLPIEFERNERLVFQGFAEWHAAGNDNLVRVSGQVAIGTNIAQIHSLRGDTTVCQHVFNPHAGPTRTTDGTGRPLITAGPRAEFRTSIATALKLQIVAVDRETLLQLGDAERSWPDTAFTANTQAPPFRVDAAGQQAIVADEQAGCRGRGVVQQIGWGFGVEGPFIQNAKAILLRDISRTVLLRQYLGAGRQTSQA